MCLSHGAAVEKYETAGGNYLCGSSRLIKQFRPIVSWQLWPAAVAVENNAPTFDFAPGMHRFVIQHNCTLHKYKHEKCRALCNLTLRRTTKKNVYDFLRLALATIIICGDGVCIEGRKWLAQR